jgi:hypothetical protein
MNTRIPLIPVAACLLVAVTFVQSGTNGGNVTTAVARHQVVDEGLYFDVPKNEVAYNVQIVRLNSGGYATIYHGEPKKSANKPGDAIKVAFQPGSFSFQMPAERRFAILSDPADALSALYSTDEMWGGAGNPIVVKGAARDSYYYIFFLALTDDDGNRAGEDYRHALCQVRTLDFREFDLRVELGRRIEWKPFRADSPVEWKRPWLLRDATGERICSRQPTAFSNTQGLMGSILFHDGRYYFFYTDRDTDGKTYLFFRTSPDLLSLQAGRTVWSAATRLSGVLPTGTVIRVAKARNLSRWVVLYNGYHNSQKGLRQDLFLQYTGDLSITGTNGLAGVRWFDQIAGECGISTAFLGLKSGGGIFAQHDFLTDSYGALAVPDGDDGRPQIGGLLTWADFSRGVYGGQVHWARWLAAGSSSTADHKRSSANDSGSSPASTPSKPQRGTE